MTDKMMRALTFAEFGDPAAVLRLEEVPIPAPGPTQVLVRVHACGLNPADWALVRGQFDRELPWGVGLDVSGTVAAVGEDVTELTVGDRVFGRTDYLNQSTGGAADYAVFAYWERLPHCLSYVDAAALPMVVETAARYVDWSGLQKGDTVFIHGAGTMVGFAAVQMAVRRGAQVVATAGSTFADRLRRMGALVTPYGEGMVERVRKLLDMTPDVVIDCSPANLESADASALPDLVEIAGGDATRVITVADFEGARRTGVRLGPKDPETSPEGGIRLRWEALAEYAGLAAQGGFTVPVTATYPLEDWRSALDASLAGRARGKLVLTVSDQQPYTLKRNSTTSPSCMT
jgi:NADPH:quinone reductase-like Zn-dependent oxidoreductase